MPVAASGRFDPFPASRGTTGICAEWAIPVSEQKDRNTSVHFSWGKLRSRDAVLIRPCFARPPCNLANAESGILACAVAGRRSRPPGAAEPVEKLGSRPAVHRTRTVAWAARRARLCKDGRGWARLL